MAPIRKASVIIIALLLLLLSYGVVRHLKQDQPLERPVETAKEAPAVEEGIAKPSVEVQEEEGFKPSLADSGEPRDVTKPEKPLVLPPETVRRKPAEKDRRSYEEVDEETDMAVEERIKPEIKEEAAAPEVVVTEADQPAKSKPEESLPATDDVPLEIADRKEALPPAAVAVEGKEPLSVLPLPPARETERAPEQSEEADREDVPVVSDGGPGEALAEVAVDEARVEEVGKKETLSALEIETEKVEDMITVPEPLIPEPSPPAPALPVLPKKKEYDFSGGKPLDENKIALLPFRDYTDSDNRVKELMHEVKRQLEGKGFTLVDGEALEEFLCRERVRDRGLINRVIARKVGDVFGAGAVVTGSLVSFSDKENPQIGVLARLVDSRTGDIRWADFASVTGEEFQKILGLGTIRTLSGLMPKVVERLMKSITTNASEAGGEAAYRVAVMPFQNSSGFRNAGLIASEMFLIELVKHPGFRPVEYGDIRKTIVDLRVRNKGDLDHNNLKALSDALPAQWIVVGTVDRYAPNLVTPAPPQVEISARLLDGGSGRILWYNNVELNGEERIIAFDWGRLRSVDRVAYAVVADLVNHVGKYSGERLSSR